MRIDDFSNDFMPLKEAAELLHIKTESLYGLRARGNKRLIVYSFGGRKKFVKKSDIMSKFRAE